MEINFQMLNREKYFSERQQQLTFLNTVLGGFSFTISLACLQMQDPRMAINISAPFIIGLAVVGFQIFPNSIRLLRERAKQDPAAKELNEYISSTDYGPLSLFKYFFPYIYGYGFFLAVLHSPEYMKGLLN
jgi:hypothetical protein